MKNHILSIGVLAALTVSCSVREMDRADCRIDETFVARMETPAEADTKVFVDDNLRVLWDANDRVSIFNKYTYNQEYRFDGETGDNSGAFKKVPNDDFIMGNSLDLVYSVYPYQESTKINNDGVLTVTLPSEQSSRTDSFGLGANSMVSCTENNELLFKNLCGYLILKLYGDNVTVKSISLKGNNNEPMAGKATVHTSVDAAPTMTFGSDATQEITLVLDTPVKIGSAAETATIFWLVVPPTTFSKGFTLTVKDNKNGVFEKTTSKSFEVKRNKVERMSALEVVPEPSDDAIVFADENVKAKLVAAFDTNGDGELSYKEAAAVTSGDNLKNAFGAIKTYKSFREFQYFTSVKSIPESFFSSWNQLSSLEIPSSIESIGDYAFKNCICLSSLVLPDNLQVLGYGVFAGCSSLKRIRIPDSVSGALGRFISLEHSNPSGFHGDGVFEDCTSLEEVVLSKNITVLGVYCFYNCTKLSNLILPSSIKILNIGTFSGCKKLSSIAVPESMSIIPSQLFHGCSSLSTVTIPNHVTKIGNSAFEGCQSITCFRIPESVSSIGTRAFSGCTSMTSVSIPESISIIESETFQDCGITTVIIPESVTSIAQSAFRRCRALESINIPNSVTSISKNAFMNCSSLLSITIPQSVTNLGDHVFQGCTSLSSVSLPDTELVLSSTFMDCSGLEEIVIPSKVGLFYTFENCTSLKYVIFTEGRERIGVAAFRGCSALKDVTIPKDVVSINTYAFSGCSGLTSITCKATIPPSGASLMFPSTGDYVIYVPAESVEAYKSASKWSDYADRILAIGTPVAVDLGLSVRWASFNLGASAPEEYGDYYAWGETEPYYSNQNPLTWKDGKESGYIWSSYKWCMGDYSSLTKYCSDSEYGYNGFTDTKIVLDSEDDAARVNLCGSWRMPTDAEWTELRNNCTWTWTTQNGVDGYLVIGPNGNCIFFPAAGYRGSTDLYNAGSDGVYWSSSLYTDDPGYARNVYFYSDSVFRSSGYRYYGRSVRPVSE